MTAEAPAMDERNHLAGCPATRIESYPATLPTGVVVEMVRCIECGGSEVRALGVVTVVATTHHEQEA